jgi:3-phenylpropionate/cinnamic acid dioxygenase small subunit
VALERAASRARRRRGLPVRGGALLDEWRLDEWHALLHRGRDLSRPVTDVPDAEPDNTLFLIDDDAARLRSRVEQLLGKSTWSENPHSRTRRLLATCGSARTEGARAWVTANFAVYRMRSNQTACYVGRYEYVLERAATGSGSSRGARSSISSRCATWARSASSCRRADMDLGIAGRRAIVCGASKGLGRGCAEALAREGVDVWLVARSPERSRRPRARSARRRARASTTVCRGRRDEDGPARDPRRLRGPRHPREQRGRPADRRLPQLVARGLDPRARREHALGDRPDPRHDRRHDRAPLRPIVSITSHMVKAPMGFLALSNGARAGTHRLRRRARARRRRRTTSR